MRKLCPFFLSVFCYLPLSSQNAGDSLFGSSLVHDIRITFPQTGYWDSLTTNYNASLNSDVDIYLPGNVTIDGNPLDSVGVRLKGNASYSHPGMKKSMKLSFDQYHSSQRYDGLKSIHLDNSAFDPSMLREKLMLDILHHHGILAPRCTFAAVYVNGGYVGLYKIIETIDKTFLKTNFTYNDGNLFKGDPNGTLQWKGPQESSYYSDYELKTNNTQNNWSDLVDLTDRINNSGGYFPQQMQSRFDIDEYLWTLAANNLFVNLDSYMANPHNYYLYDDSLDGKFHWISWDVGLSFGVFPLWFQSQTVALDIFYLPKQPDKVPLNVHLFEYPEFRQTYMNAFCTYLNDDFNARTLFPKIDSLADRIRSYVYAEPDSNRMYTTAQFEGNLGYTSVSVWVISKIPGLKSFINQRGSDVGTQLCQYGWTCSSGYTATKFSDPAIRIFPNPSSDQVTVYFEAPDPAKPVHYCIYDMLGNRIFDKTEFLESGRYERTLDFTTKPSGVYVMKVESSCNEIEQKIVVVH
ncbi:MAG TPA: CotH kinase family protein [Bacteroidia bacterium]|nr:CotH kinase family protein [Bacteroidia bacterium]